MAERSLEHLVRRRTAGSGVDVFAVEHTAAQLVWSHLPEGTHEVELQADDAATRTITVEGTGAPGSAIIGELRPGTDYTASLGGVTRQLTTLPDPPGDELFRFATVSDLHLGRGDRRYSGPLAQFTAQEHTAAEQPTPARPSPTPTATTGLVDHQWLCAASAIDEAIAWGAQLLVVKGDLCEESYDWIWDQAAELLGHLPVPVLILPGNHDTGRLRQFEPEVGAAARGLQVTRGVAAHDVPGLRIVLVDSTTPGNGWGAVGRHAADVADLVAETRGGVFLATHHHPQRFRAPLFWPHGIPGPEANRFARTVGAANPSVLASSGHTHRCRRRQVAGRLDWTEVAATNHFPGVWAGYTVHEGGLTQTVRRIAAPDALAWTERTRDVLAGVWALWATGSLSDRCFTRAW